MRDQLGHYSPTRYQHDRLDTSVLWRNIEIPIDLPFYPIPFLQPLIRLREVSAGKLYANQLWLGRREVLQLTNPFDALSGLGCTALSTRCLFLSTFSTLFAAGLPHAKYTTPLVRLSATISITFCVNFSHPLSLWLLASCALTVRQVLRSRTPLSDHGVSKPPFLGGGLKFG